MSELIQRRVTSQFFAVTLTTHSTIVIQAGTIIETCDGLLTSDLRGIRFDGKDLMAFAKDICERTERVEAQPLHAG
jgi:hypothetical protein